MRLDDLPGVRHDVAVAARVVVLVEGQIDGGEAELPHLCVGRAVGPARTIFSIELVRDPLAGLVVRGEEIEAAPLPAPVLHDLRGQLDEVPGDVRAGEASNAHAAEAVVQQVAELVKERLDLAMREQRGLAADRRIHVGAEEPEMRRAAAVPDAQR